MIKLVTLFLIGMVVLAMFGRLKVPGLRRYCSRCGKKLGPGGRCDCSITRRRG